MKNFYVGLPAMKFLGGYQNFEYLCNTYKDYIYMWYTTAPFGQIFHTRYNALVAPIEENFLELKQCISILKSYQQKIQFTFNNQGLAQMDISYSQEVLDGIIELYGKPDSIVGLDFLLPMLSLYEIPLGYSFNNYYQKTKFKNLKYCDTIVIGGSQYLQNIKFIESIKNKKNIQIELLLNNGCHKYCNKDCTNCKKNFLSHNQKDNYIDLMAEQILLPEELNLFPKNLIDFYKISSRPSNFDWLNKVLYFYTQQISINDILQILDLTKAQNWTYFSKSAVFIDYLKQFEPLDLSAFLCKKEQLWEQQNIKKRYDIDESSTKLDNKFNYFKHY